MMSAFILLQVDVKDENKLKIYTDAAPATVKAYNGSLVFRGKVSEIVSGDPGYTFAVVLKFPDAQSANDWYESDAYQNLIENRDKAANVIATRYDEVDFF